VTGMKQEVEHGADGLGKEQAIPVKRTEMPPSLEQRIRFEVVS
jgi:hypothetical protein